MTRSGRWRGGREAEGGGLLNRYTGLRLYRGFESLPLRESPARGAFSPRGVSPLACARSKLIWSRARFARAPAPLAIRFPASLVARPSVPRSAYHALDAPSPLRPVLRPATSTSAARAPRSSTGCSPKHYGGQFLLRIEDTDKARSTDDSTRAIFEGLEWLGLTGTRTSSTRARISSAIRPTPRGCSTRGSAYRCFCTPAELDERRKAAEARGDAFKYDRRCDRLPRDEVDAPRRGRRSVRPALPRARGRRRRGTTSSTARSPFRTRTSGGLRHPPLRRDADLQHGRRLRRHRDAHHARHARRRSHLQHAEADPALRGARRAAPAVRAPADDPRHSTARSSASVTARRPSATTGTSASCRRRCSTSSRCSAGRPGNDIEVMTMPQMIELFSVDGLLEEGGGVRSEEARVDERPAPRACSPPRSSRRSSRRHWSRRGWRPRAQLADATRLVLSRCSSC